MKIFSTLLLATFLLTACQQNTELSFDEKAAQDEAAMNEKLAETREERTEDREAAEEKFAQMEPTDEDGDGYKTFNDPDYGIQFDFPADWTFEMDGSLEFYRIDLSKLPIMDGCQEGQAHLIFTLPMSKDGNLSFEDFIRANLYSEQGGMGMLGGSLQALTLGGQSAFQAESSGYEAIQCQDETFVVETNATEYLFIGVFTGANHQEAEAIQKILDSLVIN
jgi:hypothetical protein